MVIFPFRSSYPTSCRKGKLLRKMKFLNQIIATVFAVAIAVDYCSATGLLGALGGYYGQYGCGCGCAPPAFPPPPPPGLDMSLAHKFAISKIPSLGLGCPSTCTMVHSKPCLLTKLLLLKKKLMEKKMMLGCKHHHHKCCCM